MIVCDWRSVWPNSDKSFAKMSLFLPRKLYNFSFCSVERDVFSRFIPRSKTMSLKFCPVDSSVPVLLTDADSEVSKLLMVAFVRRCALATLVLGLMKTGKAVGFKTIYSPMPF